MAYPNWAFKTPPEGADTLAQALFLKNWQKVIAQLLLERGVQTPAQAQAFFNPSVKDLHNPLLMKGMQDAVRRIMQAIDTQENILIYGDYDVDGTCAVSLVYLFISSLTHKVSFYLPDRYKEGYGVSYQGIDFAHDNDVSLIIALDCGTNDTEKIAYAKEKGIDFIVCDHHLPSHTLPDAVAILNPKQPDCPYPYKELCGCGIGFKLVQALCQELDYDPKIAMQYIDLVAIATAADIVPITGENRVLLHIGLLKIEKQPLLGVQSLLKTSALLGKEKITTTDLVFGIAPRINAAGRMAHASSVVELLTSYLPELSEKLAQRIEILNQERKDLDKIVAQEALEQIEQNHEQNRNTTVVFNPEWHKGIIGIVASRLMETYYRPTLVFTQSGGKLVASARSVRGFDVHQALGLCSDLIEQFGGHKYAAGLTILPENYAAFKEKFEQVVAQHILPEQLSQKIEIDAQINLSDISAKFISILNRFAPFGPQNMKPVFLARQVLLEGITIGSDASHLRLNISNTEGNVSFVGVGFGLAKKFEECFPTPQNALADIVFSIEENFWQGRTTLQLVVRDFEPAR